MQSLITDAATAAASAAGVPEYLVYAVVGTVVAGLGAAGVLSPKIRKKIVDTIRRARNGGGTAAVLLAALVLAGCAGALGESRVDTDFQNQAEVIGALSDFCSTDGVECDRELVAAATAPIPATITWVDGKDRKQLNVSLDISEGTFTYGDTEVSSTDPAKVRAEIADSVGEDAVKALDKALPNGIAGLVSTLKNAGV